MINKKSKILKHLQIIEKKFSIDLEVCKKELSIQNNSELNYKNYIWNIKKMLSENYKSEKLNLSHFKSWIGGVDLVKLDVFLFNQLIGIEKNLHDLSGAEKLELYIQDKSEFKNLKYILDF